VIGNQCLINERIIKSNLVRESFELVHKTSLNDSFRKLNSVMKWIDRNFELKLL